MTDHPHGAGSQEPDGRQDGRPVLGASKAHESARKVCPGCGELFTPTRSNKKACRPSCRARASDRKLGKMPKLPWDMPDTKLTYCARVAAYFKAHPGQWVDGRVLATIGGAYAWRTRVSECRTQLGMVVKNRERKVDGYTVSEYRLELPAETQAAVGQAEAVV